MSSTTTGNIVLAWVGPAAYEDPDAQDGVRVVDQMNITLRSEADEKDCQFTMPADKAPGEQQLEQWQTEGTKITVFWSTQRVNVFAIDPNAKGEDGKPKFRQAGKKLAVGKTTMEVGNMMTFQAYDVQPAGSVDLAAVAQKAHGAYLQQQAEYKKRSVAAKRKKAEDQVAKKRKEVKDRKDAKKAS